MTKEQVIKRVIHEQICINKANDMAEYSNIYLAELEELDLSDLILDLMEFPQDNTVALRDEFGDDWYKQKNIINRDYLVDIITDAKNIEETYEKLLKEREGK